MSTEIIKVLDYIGEKVGVTIDWTSANVMPYLQELCGKYIRYEIATSIVWLIAGIILLIVAIITARCAKKISNTAKQSSRGYTTDDEEWNIIICVAATIVCTGVGIGLVLSNTFEIITCLTFPEKVIFEYVQTLLQQNA